VNPGDATSRPLTDVEQAVIERLLTVPFPGRDELRAQLTHVMVEGGCACGCVTINLAVDRAVATPAPIRHGAPVSADISDDEYDAGIVLLVDSDGFLSCLEAYSIGDEPVRRFPPPDRIHPRPTR
jgi:hypothetical protein